MKHLLSILAIALLVGMVVPVGAAEETAPATEPEAAEAVTADQWLEQQAEVTLQQLFPGGGQCNQAVCGAGEFCCNYSCSTCAPLGGACTQQICPPVF
jgi:hypothetical protein